MNHHHAAALVLLEWYPMLPPQKGDRFDFEAPFSKWGPPLGERN